MDRWGRRRPARSSPCRRHHPASSPRRASRSFPSAKLRFYEALADVCRLATVMRATCNNITSSLLCARCNANAISTQQFCRAGFLVYRAQCSLQNAMAGAGGPPCPGRALHPMRIRTRKRTQNVFRVLFSSMSNCTGNCHMRVPPLCARQAVPQPGQPISPGTIPFSKQGRRCFTWRA